MESTTPLETRF
jgi:hypothetical protein